MHIFQNRSHCWSENASCVVSLGAFWVIVQDDVCSFLLSCFCIEDVGHQCVPLSGAGSDSDISPCSHSASFCVYLSLLALSVANIFFYYYFLAVSTLKKDGTEGGKQFLSYLLQWNEVYKWQNVDPLKWNLPLCFQNPFSRYCKCFFCFKESSKLSKCLTWQSFSRFGSWGKWGWR